MPTLQQAHLRTSAHLNTAARGFRPAGNERVRFCHTAPARRRRSPLAVVSSSTAGSAAPSRSIVILPGLGNNAADYQRLAEALRARGLHVEVAPVSRLDWARNAAGLRYPEYWRGTLAPLPTVSWYMDRVDTAMDAAAAATDGAPTTLLCHSAGGWLGRVWMMQQGQAVGSRVDGYVSLGSPQLPPPPGVVDQTRGILTWCAENCPGGLHSDVRYVTVAGRYIKGAPLLGPGTWQQRVVGAGYQQVCGEAAVWGDGVVPLPSAHLPEALNLDLDCVYHSPLGAEDGRALESVAESSDDGEQAAAAASAALVAETPPQGSGLRLWYGSQGVLERWVHLLDPRSVAAVA